MAALLAAVGIAVGALAMATPDAALATPAPQAVGNPPHATAGTVGATTTKAPKLAAVPVPKSKLPSDLQAWPNGHFQIYNGFDSLCMNIKYDSPANGAPHPVPVRPLWQRGVRLHRY